MLEKLTSDLYSALDIQAIQKQAEAIHSLEIQYGQSAFNASAQLCERFLREAGFEDVRRLALPCDGKTANQDCIMPQAWDRTGRSYFVLDSPVQETIADSDTNPFNVGMWSAPSPKGGISGPIVDWKDQDPEQPDVAGKIVLIIDHSYKAAFLKCIQAGAAAILLSDSGCPDEYPDACRWSNGIGRTGWYNTIDDAPCCYWSITPAQAQKLRGYLAEGKTLTGHGEIATKIYDGEIHTITGLIPGTSQKEILLVAHIYEPFVTDDASGASQVIGTALAIRKLVAEGKLPPLKYGIRVLIAMEYYGFSAWYENKENRERIIQVFSFDTTCMQATDGKPVEKLRHSFNGCPTFTDWIIRNALEQYPDVAIHDEAGNLSDDTFPSEHEMNIPTVWMHNSQDPYHHNQAPCFAAPDWDMARIASACLGTGAAVLAAYGKDELAPLLPQLLDYAAKAFAARLDSIVAQSASLFLEPDAAYQKMLFWEDCTLKRLRFLNTCADGVFSDAFAKNRLDAMVADAAAKLDEPSIMDLPHAAVRAKNMIVKSLCRGTISSQARVPFAERFPVPVNAEIARAFCDGTITLFQAVQKMEFSLDFKVDGKLYNSYIAYFRNLEKYGYVKITPKYVTTPDQFIKVLDGMGLKPGSKVLMHSSYASLGEMKGGPQAVLQALMDHLTPEGLLMLPIFNFYKFDADGVYDPRTTPSQVGAFTNAFRTMQGVHRSLCPSHSFATWGKDAEKYVENHHNVIVHGEGSPMRLLAQDDGMILMVECPSSVTYMHAVELSLHVPCLHPAGESYPVRFPDGSVKDVKTWSWRNGHCPVEDLRETWKLMRKYKLLTEGSFANARLLLFKIRDFEKCHREILQRPGVCDSCKIKPRVGEHSIPELKNQTETR